MASVSADRNRFLETEKQVAAREGKRRGGLTLGVGPRIVTSEEPDEEAGPETAARGTGLAGAGVGGSPDGHTYP